MSRILQIFSTGLLLAVSAYGGDQLSSQLQKRLIIQNQNGLIQSKPNYQYQHQYKSSKAQISAYNGVANRHEYRFEEKMATGSRNERFPSSSGRLGTHRKK